MCKPVLDRDVMARGAPLATHKHKSHLAEKTRRRPRTADLCDLRCQVPGCTADLQMEDKLYCRARHVCAHHLQAEAIECPETHQQLRFCLQCARLEPLSAFEGTHRSCQASLLRRRERSRANRSRAADDSKSTDTAAAASSGGVAVASSDPSALLFEPQVLSAEVPPPPLPGTTLEQQQLMLQLQEQQQMLQTLQTLQLQQQQQMSMLGCAMDTDCLALHLASASPPAPSTPYPTNEAFVAMPGAGAGAGAPASSSGGYTTSIGAEASANSAFEEMLMQMMQDELQLAAAEEAACDICMANAVASPANSTDMLLAALAPEQLLPQPPTHGVSGMDCFSVGSFSGSSSGSNSGTGLMLPLGVHPAAAPVAPAALLPVGSPAVAMHMSGASLAQADHAARLASLHNSLASVQVLLSGLKETADSLCRQPLYAAPAAQQPGWALSQPMGSVGTLSSTFCA